MATLDFWARPNIWPRDASGYVFLARGVDEIGRAMFGDEWTGKEVTTEYVRSLPEQSRASLGEKVHAHRILMSLPDYANRHETEAIAQLKHRAHEARQASRLNVGSAANRFPPSLTRLAPQRTATPSIPSIFRNEDWFAAQAFFQREQNAQLPALQRRGAVWQEIVSRCESGDLVSALRATAGGGMTIISKELWNTERWHQRFTMCQMNPRKPFALGFSGDDFCWIFLSRTSLDAYLHATQGQSGRGTISREKASLSELTGLLKSNNKMRRDDARKHCVSKFRISQRGFQRIWPQAREQAGLPRHGSPGRKKS